MQEELQELGKTIQEVELDISACHQIQNTPCAIRVEYRATVHYMELNMKSLCREHMNTMFPVLSALLQHEKQS